ncbi:MAG: type I-U CRISPR-associated protein Cas7 [Proteobacteria bacterium]|nr:type I-U CRISPR-associated protein Cas7 [Pseudomonadota bacterium]
MTLDLSALSDAPRLLIEAHLDPLQGTRFQPTGFPEIGPAQYDGPCREPMLLVESTQSMANRLEAVCWDKVVDDWVAPLKGLSVVRVNDKSGKPLTNSVLEAHRINSEYIARMPGFEPIRKAMGYEKDRRFSVREQLVPVLLAYDINSLLHGVFLEEVAGVIRLPRAVSAFVEARNVTTASSGGVKVGLEPGQKSGDGNVIFARDEFVSPEIRAFFNVDLAQLRGYGLGDDVFQLLVALALFKVRAFLESGLRLRTACDLKCTEVEVERPAGFALPTLADLAGALPALIDQARPDGGFQQPVVVYKK